MSGTALSGLHHKQSWLALGRSLVERESVRESAQRCGVAVTTAFRWRHRFMAQAGQLQGRLEGLVEADEAYVLHSRKGQRQLVRKALRRGESAPGKFAGRAGAAAGQRRGAAERPVGERTRAVRGGWGSSTRR